MNDPGALLFDLDGCLVDSLPSIGRCWRETFAVTATDVDAFPGIHDALAELHERDATLAVTTSKGVEIARLLLARLDLERYFTVVEGTRIGELGAEKTTVVARALEALGPHPAGAVIGDREHDVRAARAHGLRAVGVLWGYGSQAELERAGAHVLVREPSELSELVLHRL